MSMPKSAAIDGSSRLTKMVATSGKMTFSNFVTSRSCSMTTSRSAFVVKSFMMGG